MCGLDTFCLFCVTSVIIIIWYSLIFITISLFVFQSFPGPSLESEDFNIPPITPPSLPDHSLVHLNEIESGYHSLCHPMNHNGLLPFHPQNMDLPEITVSNMLGQDGTLLSNSLSVVSIFSRPLLYYFKL